MTRLKAGTLALLTASLSGLGPLTVRAQDAQVATPPDVKTVLAAASTYLDAYEKKFSALVAEERYTLTSTRSRPDRRVLRSDVVDMNLGGSRWLQFRDVYAVDGKPVRDHDSRLKDLFLRPNADVLSEAQRIADESARYNLGVQRNINVPTMALTYLGRNNQDRSDFDTETAEVVDGRNTIAVHFRETAKPTVIRARLAQNAPASGRFWIDPASGEVLRTELRCVVTDEGAPLIGTITVTYATDPKAKILVPVAMDEEWQHDQDVDRGHADYSDWRVFTVDAASLRRIGGGGD